MSDTSFYQEDLAFVHDTNFGQVAYFAAQHLHQLLTKRKIHSGLIVDLGCGSGILAQQLTEAGFQVLGIDYSSAMIDIAKVKAPKASFQVGSFLDIDLPACDVVTATGEIFNYLIDEKNTLQALEALFHKIYQQLQPHGVFMFDIFCTGTPVLSGQRLIESKDWDMVIQYKEEETDKKLTRDILLYRKLDKDAYRKSKEIHTVQLYEPDTIFRMLTRAGFSVSSIDHYETYTFRNRHVGFIGTK